MHIVTQRRVELAYQLADDVQMVEPFSPVRSTVTLFGFTNYLEKKLKNREGPKVLHEEIDSSGHADGLKSLRGTPRKHGYANFAEVASEKRIRLRDILAFQEAEESCN